jgi:hypothetical protein
MIPRYASRRRPLKGFGYTRRFAIFVSVLKVSI